MAQMQRCPNCGTEWTPDEVIAAEGDQRIEEYTCPLCHFHVTPPASMLAHPAITTDELQARMAELLATARTSGVPLPEIVALLRDELAFEAELSAPGRRMLVQVIDLGQFEPDMQPMRSSGERELILSRSLAR